MKVIKDRLDIQGYSLRNANKEFKKAVRYQINYELGALDYLLLQSKENQIDTKQLLDKNNEENVTSTEPWEKLEDWLKTLILRKKNEIQFLRNATFESYCDDVCKIVKRRYTLKLDKRSSVESFVDYSSYDKNVLFLLRTYSPFFTIRILLERYKNNEVVTYDLTDIINEGYESIENINLIYEGKVIVLTEGSTDARILEKSMHLLYPHLKGYYHFFDFDLSNMPG